MQINSNGTVSRNQAFRSSIITQMLQSTPALQFETQFKGLNFKIADRKKGLFASYGLA